MKEKAEKNPPTYSFILTLFIHLKFCYIELSARPALRVAFTLSTLEYMNTSIVFSQNFSVIFGQKHSKF